MIRTILRKRRLLAIYIIMVLVLFILPHFSVQGYTIMKNTTSHLGAQNTPNAWIMNLIFFLLGFITIQEAWIYLKQYWVQKFMLTIFGLGLVGVAIFKHAPIVQGIPYSLFEDTIHSIFASIVGFSFTLFTVSAAFIETTNKRRIIALLVGVVVTVLSVLMSSLPDFAGIWQRLIFIISFAWLIIFLKRLEGEMIVEKDLKQ